MESNNNFDLDINNYTTDDLIKFFRLNNNYSLNDLITKEVELATEILSVDNSKYNSKYKFDIINFIKSAKEVLMTFYDDIQNIKKMNEIKLKYEKQSVENMNAYKNKYLDPNVGQIINPLASHPALNVNINPNNSIDGYNYNANTSVYVFNTAARNDFFSTQSSSATFDLPIVWKNVIQITLSSANIPNVMYAFNTEAGTNQIYIKEEDTGLSGIVSIPEGNYVPYTITGLLSVLPITYASFPDVLAAKINSTLGTVDRFSVTFDPANYSMTISNSKHNFSINTIIKNPTDLCGPYSNLFVDNSINTNITNKSSINVVTYVQTLGYLMGYREIFYSGSKSYTTESVFSNTYSNYLYFTLEDYTGSQPSSNTYGIVGQGILSQNILGVIPISSGVFTTTFDNNANFIYKKREYYGPVDISRISIKILNQKGNLVNLHGTDFSFALQVKSIYDLSQKTKPTLRGLGVF